MKISEFCAEHKVSRQYVNQLLQRSIDNSFKFRGKYFFGKLDETGHWSIEPASADFVPERKTHAEVKQELDEAKRDLTRDQIERNRAAYRDTIVDVCQRRTMTVLSVVRTAIVDARYTEAQVKIVADAIDFAKKEILAGEHALKAGGDELEEDMARLNRAIAERRRV